jgi:hypothetical protein
LLEFERMLSCLGLEEYETCSCWNFRRLLVGLLPGFGGTNLLPNVKLVLVGRRWSLDLLVLEVFLLEFERIILIRTNNNSKFSN